MVIEGQEQQRNGDGGGGRKHYCRVCKKGFGCGQALGGHMRVHGMGDGGTVPPNGGADNDSSYDWERGKHNPTASSKRMYSLRTNYPSRLKTCSVCENCGKEFFSWKSFVEHGRRSYEDDVDLAAVSLLSSPKSDNSEDDVVRGWSKRKRTSRSKDTAISPSSEEKELAKCLVMLSTARVDPTIVAAEQEVSCASASMDEHFRRPRPHHSAAEVHLQPGKWKALAVAALPPVAASASPRGIFECKACKKVFNSHQALGGHRASHKKVKGCFAVKLDGAEESDPPAYSLDGNAVAQYNTNNANALAMATVPLNSAPMAAEMPLKNSKVHECSICHRVFSSGQALGGHKRCHWITSSSTSGAADPAPALGKLDVLPLHQQSHLQTHQLQLMSMFETCEAPLDLNLPVAGNQLAQVRHDVGDNPLRLDVPTSIYIQKWAEDSKSNFNEGSKNPDIDDETANEVKLAKLSEVKDVNVKDDQSSSWLQVGIGSSTNDRSDQP